MTGWKELKATKRLERLPIEERIEIAARRTDRLIDHVRSLLLMHEANAIALYSPTLVEQVPRSYAARAFSQFQQSMYLYELIRVFSIWDGVGDDRENIPTIVHLYDKPDIVDAIVERRRLERERRFDPVVFGEMPEGEDWRLHMLRDDAERSVRQTREALQTASQRTAEVLASGELKALRELRDRYIAHNLEARIQNGLDATEVSVWRYGEEANLLDYTVEITSLLQLALCGSSFDWDGARDHARRNASDLWSACTFQIPRH